MNAPIPDGDHDAFVVDARAHDDGTTLALALTTGARKGDVVDVATTETLDEVTVIGLPCTLVVEDGAPRVVF